MTEKVALYACLERRAEVVPIWHDRAWLRARLPTSVNAW